MSRTQLASENYGEGLTKRVDLNTDEPGSAVITRALAGPGIRLVSTGVDDGTGDVTIKLAFQDILKTQFLTSNGTAGGSAAMNVNGSVTPVPFWIPAHATEDWYLDKVILVIEDDKIDFAKFGDVAALTNGFDLILKQGGVNTPILDKAKTDYEILRQSGADFDAINKKDADKNGGLIIRIVLDSPRLEAGSSDEIRAVVNDNITGLVSFTARVFYRRLS